MMKSRNVHIIVDNFYLNGTVVVQRRHTRIGQTHSALVIGTSSYTWREVSTNQLESISHHVGDSVVTSIFYPSTDHLFGKIYTKNL